MTLTYTIVDRKTGEELQAGALKYKSVDSFEQYQMYKDGTDFDKAYQAGHIVTVFENGEKVGEYRKKGTLYLDMWDNYESNDPKRLEAIHEAGALLDEFGIVKVSFDYTGRTRHELAAKVFYETMLKAGYDCQADIGYNYHFELTK